MRASERGTSAAEVIAGLCILAAGVFIMVRCLGLPEEYVILEVPTYMSGNDAGVKFKVREGHSEAFMMDVPVEGVEVRQRLDSEKYASLMCRRVYDQRACQSATVLVPKEDVAAWQAEVNRWKSLRQPPHVVPKPQ